MKRERLLKLENTHVWADAQVTQVELAKATLPYGLIPPVIAEFKKITVGGALMGASLESSSHRFGQFNEAALELDLELADGTRLRASREENSDLFWGVSGSYGSLARLISAKLALIPAKKYVQVVPTSYSSLDVFTQDLTKKEEDYVEGLVLGEKDALILAGTLTDSLDLPLYSQKPSHALWFHQKVLEKREPFQMTLEDYLFRYDRGAFWMGTYALFPELLMSFWLGRPPSGTYHPPRLPGLLFRTLAGWLMNSSTLYSWLHWQRENWFEKNFVVQDFYLPSKHAALFIKESLRENGITPLWICPCKASLEGQIFSPHQQKGELVFDIGVYGWPKPPLNGPGATRLLEKRTYALGGKKMFYSWNYLTPEELWQHYPKETYLALREKYRATFPCFTEKVMLRY